MKLKSIECVCSSLRKRNESIVSSEEDVKDKYDRLKDRLTLMERANGNLEFELDTLQEDQDVLSDQALILRDQNSELKSENQKLKRIIDDMKNSDSQGIKSEASICCSTGSGSTWNEDSSLSYGSLETNMDSMIEKMSRKQPEPETEPIEEAREEEESVDGNLDDSFDESMFLPNFENHVAAPTESANDATSKGSDCVVASNQSDKENSDAKPCVSFCSTPSKGDYGKRRIPLSDRKNRTPLTSASKRIRSSSTKLMSSSKKSRTNYMLINNKQLFH
jgi:hypothetical protein